MDSISFSNSCGKIEVPEKLHLPPPSRIFSRLLSSQIVREKRDSAYPACKSISKRKL